MSSRKEGCHRGSKDPQSRVEPALQEGPKQSDGGVVGAKGEQWNRPRRRQAHALLDMLPADKLNAVRSLLEVMVEPLARSLALAPVEEEELTEEQ